MIAPELPALLWRDWAPSWGLDAQAAGASLLYLLAARRVRGRWPLRRTVAFMAGVGTVVIALQSGVGALDDEILSDHMVQHLLLLELAPLLLWAGRPGLLALRSVPRRHRPGLARTLIRLRPVTHPVLCLAVFGVVVGVTHLAFFYDATLSDPALHYAEHVLYLGAGLLLWWPILDSDPVPGRRLGGLGRLAYVIAAMVPMTIIGAYLDRHTTLVYAPYGPAGHGLGISPLLDQQQAGAIMWVLGTVLMVLAGLWQSMAAMTAEEHRLQVAERSAAARSLIERERVG
jgi:putative copper resistance protein D